MYTVEFVLSEKGKIVETDGQQPMDAWTNRTIRAYLAQQGYSYAIIRRDGRYIESVGAPKIGSDFHRKSCGYDY